MSNRLELSLGQRLGVRIADLAIWVSLGHPVPYLSEEVVRRLGMRGIMKMPSIAKTIKACMKQFEPRDAQMLIGFAALWDGCLFCSRGHVLAANLYQLQHHDSVLPIGEAEVLQLRELEDHEAMARIEELLKDAQYDRLRFLLRRQFDLRMGLVDQETADDLHIVLTLHAWDWVTECSIVLGIEIDVPPLAPIVHASALLQRYRTMRPTVHKSVSRHPND